MASGDPTPNPAPPAVTRAPAAGAELRLGGTLAAFRYRNYRLYFVGQFVLMTGAWLFAGAMPIGSLLGALARWWGASRAIAAAAVAILAAGSLVFRASQRERAARQAG